MKKLANLFFFIIMLSSYSCDKYEYPDTELTVNELYNFCATNGKYPCNELLNNEGDLVTVIGFYRVSNNEYNFTGNKFIFYDSPTTGSINTEVTILNDSKSVFDKISQLADTNSAEEHIKLKISGKIVGHDLPTNNACSRGVFIEIDGAKAVRVY